MSLLPELHLQDLNALYRAVTSAGLHTGGYTTHWRVEASSGRGSSDECEDDEDIVSAIT